jgi:AraC-like DNA-binding protein
MTQLFHKTAGELIFKPCNVYSMKGPYLAGSTVEESTSFLQKIRFQYWTGKELSLEHRWFNFSSDEILEAVTSSSSLRLEILLSGFLNLKWDNQYWTAVQAGNYWFSEKTRTTFKFNQSVGAQMLVAYLPSYWGHQLVTSGESFGLEKPYPLVPSMFNVLDELMHHGYTSNLYEIFYEKCSKDLIFYHLLYNGYNKNSNSDKIVPAYVLDADALITADLSRHYKIDELAKKVGTNSTYLKRAYKEYFLQGLFDRLQDLRLLKAKDQLIQSNHSIKDIAMEAGFQHVANFINAFRKRFGIAPGKWRDDNR